MSKVLTPALLVGIIGALAGSLAAAKDVSKGSLPDGAAELIEQGNALVAELESGEAVLFTSESVVEALDAAGLVELLTDEQHEALKALLATDTGPEWEGLPIAALEAAPALELFGHLTENQQAELNAILGGGVEEAQGQRAEGQPVGFMVDATFFNNHADAVAYIARTGNTGSPRPIGYLG